MEMIHVDSSHIEAIGYDGNQARLEIEFKNGTAYEYYDVPQHIYDELMCADSKGKYAHQNIYKVFKQQRIR